MNINTLTIIIKIESGSSGFQIFTIHFTKCPFIKTSLTHSFSFKYNYEKLMIFRVWASQLDFGLKYPRMEGWFFSWTFGAAFDFLGLTAFDFDAFDE